VPKTQQFHPADLETRSSTLAINCAYRSIVLVCVQKGCKLDPFKVITRHSITLLNYHPLHTYIHRYIHTYIMKYVRLYFSNPYKQNSDHYKSMQILRVFEFVAFASKLNIEFYARQKVSVRTSPVTLTRPLPFKTRRQMQNIKFGNLSSGRVLRVKIRKDLM
jgi:hypothetical protein